MLGKNFTTGLTYRDESRWVRVKSRGPVITKGVEWPTIRLTVDDNGTIRRTRVYANRDYETRPVTATKHPRREWIVPSMSRLQQQQLVALANTIDLRTPSSQPVEPVRNYPQAPTKPRRRKARPAALSGRATSPVRVSRSRSATTTARSITSREFPAIVAVPENEYCDEACYWLPPNTHHVTAGQYAILDALSELLWVDAPAAVWRDRELIEHDAPIGLTGTELTAAVQQVKQPTPRQVRSLERTIGHLIERGLIERTSTHHYRLRGWECLHTKRRTTRRAIERGGGRAMYAYVRHSA